MNRFFEDLKEGLEEAIEYERGNGKAKCTVLRIVPVKKYSNEQIRRIRMKVGMTQTALAGYMGVSKKTVEAWENGRTHPTGPACRLLYLLDQNNEAELPFISIEKAGS